MCQTQFKALETIVVNTKHSPCPHRAYKLVAETDNKQTDIFTIYHSLARSAVKESKAGGVGREQQSVEPMMLLMRWSEKVSLQK